MSNIILFADDLRDIPVSSGYHYRLPEHSKRQSYYVNM